MPKSEIDYSLYYIKNRHTSNDVSADSIDNNEVPLSRPHRPKKSLKSVMLVLITLGIVLLVSIVALDTLRGGYIVSTIANLMRADKSIERSYYGVVVNTLEDMDSARLYAGGVRAREGAGYVLFDDGYNVLVSVYATKKDADDVAKKLKLSGENAKVYAFDIARIDYLQLPEKSRNIVKNTVIFNDVMYKKLDAIGVDLANGNIDDNTAKSRIAGIKNEMHNVVGEFEANVDNDLSNGNIIKVKAELSSIEAMLTNLAGDTVKKPSLLSDIRYTECLIVSSYRELTKELSDKAPTN